MPRNGACSTSYTCRVTVKRCEHHLIWKSCWTPVCVNKYKYINKTWNRVANNVFTRKAQRDHNTDLSMPKYVILQHEQYEPHKNKKNRRRVQVPRKDKEFLLQQWHPSLYSCYKPAYKSRDGFFFSYLTDFSYFPMAKQIPKLLGHGESRSQRGCRWFQPFSMHFQLFEFLTINSTVSREWGSDWIEIITHGTY